MKRDPRIGNGFGGRKKGFNGRMRQPPLEPGRQSGNASRGADYSPQGMSFFINWNTFSSVIQTTKPFPSSSLPHR